MQLTYNYDPVQVIDGMSYSVAHGCISSGTRHMRKAEVEYYSTRYLP